MSKAKIYSVYMKAEVAESLENSEMVKEGFNWFAFFLPLIWALYNKIWWLAVILVLFNTGLALLASDEMGNSCTGIVLQAMVMLVAGFFAADWQEKNLSKRGYALKDIIVAKDEQGARLKFFRRELKVV